jgi:hypothetical protein
MLGVEVYGPSPRCASVSKAFLYRRDKLLFASTKCLVLPIKEAAVYVNREQPNSFRDGQFGAKMLENARQ